jgi:hypothetical protein
MLQPVTRGTMVSALHALQPASADATTSTGCNRLVIWQLAGAAQDPAVIIMGPYTGLGQHSVYVCELGTNRCRMLECNNNNNNKVYTADN